MDNSTDKNNQVIHFVTGYIHDKKGRFLLVHKKGGVLNDKLTGIGGKVEERDFFPTNAMAREALEEIGECAKDLEWQTVGIIISENSFVNVIFHAEVDNLLKFPFRTFSDANEQHGIYSLDDIRWYEEEVIAEPALGVPQIMAHILWGDLENDRIEITRYDRTANEQGLPSDGVQLSSLDTQH